MMIKQIAFFITLGLVCGTHTPSVSAKCKSACAKKCKAGCTLLKGFLSGNCDSKFIIKVFEAGDNQCCQTPIGQTQVTTNGCGSGRFQTRLCPGSSSSCTINNSTNRGPNDMQVAPQLQSARQVSGRTQVEGTLSVARVGQYRIQFFNNQTNVGQQGELPIGEIIVTANACNKLNFSAKLPCVAAGTFITSTATLINLPCDDAVGETSQFGNNVAVS